VWLANIFDHLSPHARVATAVTPFVVAILIRLLLGRNKLTRGLLSASTVWFVINVLMAPYSERMRQDLIVVQRMFR
jgi:hypothetical protein